MKVEDSKRRVVAMIALTLGAMYLASCSRPEGSPSPTKNEAAIAVPASPQHQQAILQAVLPHYLAEAFPLPSGTGRDRAGRLVLATQTSVLCDLSSSDACTTIDEASLQRSGRHATPQELRQLEAREASESVLELVRTGELASGPASALIEANRIATPVDRKGWQDFVVPMAPADIDELLHSGNWRRNWARFHTAIPRAAGYAEVTRAVVSRDDLKALIFVRFRCGGLCGAGRVHLLEQKGDGWRVVRTIELWVN